jgi:hypothetical protein
MLQLVPHQMLSFKKPMLPDDFFLIKSAVQRHISREPHFQHFTTQYQLWLYFQQYQLMLSVQQQPLVLISF